MLRTALLVALAAAVPAQAQDGPDFSSVTALLQDSLPQFGGGEFLLRQDGRELYRASFAGWDSTRAVPIASASKWLSGTVLMSLVADGTLSLDDTVGDWLPDAPADKRAVTLRQLFAHTSGLPSLQIGGCLDDRTTTLAACAQSILEGPLLSAPGEAFRYGGLSMQVGGYLAEVASGQPFNTLFAERIATPLGLTRTDFGPGDNPRVAGGASSTAAEYARVVEMLLDGGAPALTPAAVDSMLADQTRGAEIVYSPYQSLAEALGDPALAETRYGVGVWRERVDPATGAVLEAASQGAFGFSPWIDRPNGVVAVLAVQDDLPALYPTYLELKARVGEALASATAIAAGPPSAPALSVWPNPARHRLAVAVAGWAPQSLCLVDAVGRDAACADVRGPSPYPVALSGLAPGLYLVRAQSDGRTQTRPVVVVR